MRSCQTVRIDSESLPTGIDSPSSRHSAAQASTASNRSASSAGSPLAAIQLADSLILSIDSIGAPARLVTVSTIAIREAARGSITASGVRSPIASASPRYPAKSASPTAQSATGTCQGPTIWSRAHRPPTVRSPMVIRKDLLATAGRRRTRSATSRRSSPAASTVGSARARRRPSRAMRGGLPSNTSIGMSTGRSGWPSASAASTTSCWSSDTVPTTAYGQRSRRHRWSNVASESGAIAST